MINTHAIGMGGETLAEKYLKENKYTILKRNYQTKIGEIDIIAKKENTIVFVEVKQRATLKYGYPREAVTPYKQNKIRQTALCYLKQNKLINSSVRFDCIEILNDKITHIENCF